MIRYLATTLLQHHVVCVVLCRNVAPLQHSVTLPVKSVLWYNGMSVEHPQMSIIARFDAFDARHPNMVPNNVATLCTGHMFNQTITVICVVLLIRHIHSPHFN